MAASVRVIVRDAERRDAPDIAALHVEGWEEFRAFLPREVLAARTLTRRKREWTTRLAGADPGVWTGVAEAGGEVVGFLSCQLLGEPVRGARSEIKTLYVTRRLRRSGVGRRLLAAAARWLAAHGGEPISLYSFTASSFRESYSRLGGEVAGERPTRWDGVVVPETCYLWPSAATLINACEKRRGN